MAESTKAEGVAARVFNDYLLAHALYALDRAGILRELRTCGLPAHQSGQGEKNMALECCLALMQDAGLACFDDQNWRLTDAGVDASRNIGYFVWAVGGYSAYMSALTDFLQGDNTIPSRNDALVALGSGMIGAAYLQAEVDSVLEGVRPRALADLGCGDATRLAHFLVHHPGAHGIGIERSSAATAIAQKNIAANNLAERMIVVNADCLDRLETVAFPTNNVDCVVSFFLLHDLLSQMQGSFAKVAEAVLRNFPNAETVIFADTTIDDWRSRSAAPPIFARGFQLVHTMMGVKTRTLQEYIECFSGAPLNLASTVPLGVPNSYLFLFSRR